MRLFSWIIAKCVCRTNRNGEWNYYGNLYKMWHNMTGGHLNHICTAYKEGMPLL